MKNINFSVKSDDMREATNAIRLISERLMPVLEVMEESNVRGTLKFEHTVRTCIDHKWVDVPVVITVEIT